MTAKHFHLDKRAGKLMGVCAGFAAYSGLDVVLVRVGLVILTLAALHGWAIGLYLLVGLLASDRPREW